MSCQRGKIGGWSENCHHECRWLSRPEDLWESGLWLHNSEWDYWPGPDSLGYAESRHDWAPGLRGLRRRGGSKSNAPIPQLEENITEVQWTAWKNRFDRWQASCKITDKAVENRIFESIPNTLADQICVSLSGEEDKQALLAKIKRCCGEEAKCISVPQGFAPNRSRSSRGSREICCSDSPGCTSMLSNNRQ